MRWANLLFCCLFLAFAFAGAGRPILAADLGGAQRQSYPGDRSYSDDALPEMDVGEFCYVQGQICRKICYLDSRFDNDFNGCPHSCESRVRRCVRTGCYRWVGREALIAERFGGYDCHIGPSAGLDQRPLK